MSAFEEQYLNCAVCGQRIQQTRIVNIGSYAAPDLDLRPAQMMRSTMDLWVWECPFCKYTARSLDDKSGIDPEFLKSEEYLHCSGLDLQSALAQQFYRLHLIRCHDQDDYGAYHAALCAAWACDDMGDEKNAMLCRRLALTYLEKLPLQDLDSDFTYIRMDLLRRSGRFQQLIDEYDPAAFTDEHMRKTAAFQVEKARAQDDRCYTFDFELY